MENDKMLGVTEDSNEYPIVEEVAMVKEGLGRQKNSCSLDQDAARHGT